MVGEGKLGVLGNTRFAEGASKMGGRYRATLRADEENCTVIGDQVGVRLQ